MSDSHYSPDDPTRRSHGQEQQGKLVIGNFQDPSAQGQRRPYHYQPQQAPTPQPPSQHYPQRPQQGPEGAYASTQSSAPYPPGHYPNYPQPQPGQLAGAAKPRTTRPRRRGRAGRIGCLSVVVLLLVIVIVAVATVPRVLAFGSAISSEAPLSTQTGYMGTSERTNLLIMGYGGGSHDGAYLTDSLLVVSLLPQSHHTSLVSVPRDLWVQYPPQSGNYTKINAIYEMASNNNKSPKDGAAAIGQKISLITGLDTKYWLTIDFSGFKKVIDSIGGVDVNVPTAFNACYPKNDDASVDPSWIKVQFDKGVQHMDGNRAITYARAREPLEVCGQGTSENLAELTDFGRSARQQIIVKAVLAKVKQASTWPSLYGAMDALQQTIRTNMSLADLAEFALKMDLNDPKTAHIGLSNQNVLEDNTEGAYILTAKNGNWQGIIDYVKQNLYN